jgi:hypothetical protein
MRLDYQINGLSLVGTIRNVRSLDFSPESLLFLKYIIK